MSTKTLNDYCEFIVDCLHKTAPLEEYDTGYYSIRTPDIGRGRLKIEQANRISKETYEKWTIRGVPQAGDLILAREAPVGNVGIVPENVRVCCGQRTVHIRPDRSKIDPGYLVYLMNGDEIQNKIKGYSQGVTVAHLNMEDIRALVLPKPPPLPIQRKIADVLSAYDDLIEVNTRRIRLLEQMVQSAYREWFGKVEEGSLPDGWNVSNFCDVTENLDYKRIPVSSMEREKMQGEYPYYGASGVIDHVNKYIFDGRYLLIAEDGENLRSRKTPIAFFADGKFWVNNHAHIIQAKPPMSLEYLYLFFADKDISGFITGAAQPKLSQQNLNQIPVVVPLPESMEKFNNFAQPAMQEIELLQRKNTNLRRTRDLLLPRLVSGEIRV